MSNPQQSTAPDDRRFWSLFSRSSSGVRVRLALRSLLGSASVGALCAAAMGAGAWLFHRPALLPWSGAIAGVSVVIGAVLAHCERWSDAEVALFLDGRLGSDEVIATALAVASSEKSESPSRALVLKQAERTLASMDGKRIELRVLRRSHAALPVGLAALLLFAKLASPSVAVVAPPGTRMIRAEDVQGLDLIERLREVPARDRSQRDRLDHLADDAQRLREQLREGMSQRDALDRLARLQERLAAEQLAPNSQQERRGAEAAMARLTRAGLTDAARALGDQDLQQLDRAMEQEANRQERADRERARQALEEAAQAARREGANETAHALEEQSRRLRQRSERTDALRALANEVARDPGVARALERLNRERTDNAAGALGRALDEAINRLTAEQRRALVERMRQDARSPQSQSQMGNQSAGAQGSQRAPNANELLQGILNWLEQSNHGRPQQGSGSQGDGGTSGDGGGGSSGGGQNGPITQLSLGQSMGGLGPMSSGATQSGLRSAQAGAQSASQQVGGGQGQNGSGQNGQGNNGQNGQGGEGQGQGGQNSGQGNSEGQGGPSGGGASGSHGGSTNIVQGGETIRSRANTQINGGESMAAGQQGLTAGRAGATANIRGTGDLNTVAPAELRAVEGSSVPAEYRDQVRQYFQP